MLALTFPCVATYAVMLRELGWIDTLKATGIMLIIALLAGAAMNLAL
jgi:ferrous iron transport protein B